MVEVLLQFETQEQADNAILALSKGYTVNQYYLPINATGTPYCVRVYVPKDNITKKNEDDLK